MLNENLLRIQGWPPDPIILFLLHLFLHWSANFDQKLRPPPLTVLLPRRVRPSGGQGPGSGVSLL